MMTYFVPIYYLYRTHIFGIFATIEQKLMAHNAVECTICCVKAFALVSCMIWFRQEPIKFVEGAPFDNEDREMLLNITKKSGNGSLKVNMPAKHY